jgi:hypothetical protein
MIKNWKLFLENADDDYSGDVEKDLKKLGEGLKKGLHAAFAPMFIGEMFLRFSSADVTDELKKGVDIIFETIIEQFVDVMDSKEDYEEELREVLLNALTKSLDSARETMINQSFKDGISHMVDIFVNFLIDYKKSIDNEGEEWKQEKEKDYSELSKGEINDLIDQALDSRDFAKVKFLSQYLKESYNQEAMNQIKNICRKVAELLVQFCESALKV